MLPQKFKPADANTLCGVFAIVGKRHDFAFQVDATQ
jgi:hypothetical protein